jgi:hypothetical protein
MVNSLVKLSTEGKRNAHHPPLLAKPFKNNHQILGPCGRPNWSDPNKRNCCGGGSGNQAADDYIVKSLDFSVLKNSVKKLIGKRSKP